MIYALYKLDQNPTLVIITVSFLSFAYLIGSFFIMDSMFETLRGHHLVFGWISTIGIGMGTMWLMNYCNKKVCRVVAHITKYIQTRGS